MKIRTHFLNIWIVIKMLMFEKKGFKGIVRPLKIERD
jgi:hypothetical protein